MCALVENLFVRRGGVMRVGVFLFLCECVCECACHLHTHNLCVNVCNWNFPPENWQWKNICLNVCGWYIRSFIKALEVHPNSNFKQKQNRLQKAECLLRKSLTRKRLRILVDFGNIDIRSSISWNWKKECEQKKYAIQYLFLDSFVDDG